MRNLFFVIILFALTSCSRFDCIGGTSESKPTKYRGKDGVKVPYSETIKKLDIIRTQCFAGSCSYATTATVWVHNPTSKDVGVDITCAFMISDYEAYKNTRKDVRIPAMESVKVNIQGKVDVNENDDPSLKVTCFGVFE